MSPHTAWLILQGIETLPLRMERHIDNTQKVVEFLAAHPFVSRVGHPLLESHPSHALAGRLVDERGGRIVLAAGSVVGAFAFLVLALAQNAATFIFGWVLGGVAMAATLYDPAFATLHQLSREHYRRSVTALTLIAGFASTVFWPFTNWLEVSAGWRTTFGIAARIRPGAIAANVR